MPSSFVKKVAKEKDISVDEAEKKWDEAKEKAKEEGHGDDYAYVTAIFKKMVGMKENKFLRFKDYLHEKLNSSSPNLSNRDNPD